MSDRPWLRQLYDGVERRVTPPLEQFVRTDTYADLTATLGQLRGLVSGGVRDTSAWFWHLVNLPAGSDVAHLRRQIGALDREVRRLTLALENERRSHHSGGSETQPVEVSEDADPARPVHDARPGAPRGGAQRPPGP